MAGLGRRQVLGGLASVAVTACCKREPTDAFFCANDPAYSDPRTPLTIDTHAHVFNGSDLQIEGFIKYVRLRELPGRDLLAAIVKELGRDFAPSAKQELEALKPIEVAIQNCDHRTVREHVQNRRKDQYYEGQNQLKAAVTRVLQRNAFALGNVSDAEIARQINLLPDSYDEYRNMRRLPQPRASVRSMSAAGVIDFILRNFQYRYVNIHDYLEAYSKDKERKIDLLIAHLVDYDWPIGSGTQTPTTLQEQIGVMERITMLTGGRVHCYAPFDPFKRVAWKLGLAAYDPLNMVQEAVRHRGCIGVKLYPPMGFAPTSNVRLPPTFWNASPLRSELRNRGKELDDSLNELFDWCIAEQVPVMAHTGPSNLAAPQFKALVAAEYWGKLIHNGRHGGLRVNFGHFGDTDLVDDDNGARARDYAHRMTQGKSSPGGQLYADSAYLADILGSNADKLRADLRDIMRETGSKGDAALAQRLMYGTDWEMVTVEGGETSKYLTDFETLIDKLSTDPSIGAMRF